MIYPMQNDECDETIFFSVFCVLSFVGVVRTLYMNSLARARARLCVVCIVASSNGNEFIFCLVSSRFLLCSCTVTIASIVVAVGNLCLFSHTASVFDIFAMNVWYICFCASFVLSIWM